MKKCALAFIALMILISGLSFSQTTRRRSSMFQSQLGRYRRKHYRPLPKWWYYYTYEKSNHLWISYMKTKNLLFKTYKVVVRNNLRGARFYKLGRKTYHKGTRLISKRGQWGRAVGYSLQARRYFLLALQANRYYSRRIPRLKLYVRREYKIDEAANKKDQERRKQAARNRLFGDNQRRESAADYNIYINNNEGQIQE